MTSHNTSSNTAHQRQLLWLWIIPVLLFVFFLAFPRMLSDALWLDEVYTHLSSGTGEYPSISIIETILRTAIYDLAWPPLYYIVQNLWGDVSGNSLLSERLLPTLFGVLSVALTYRLGKALIGHAGGIFAAILMGTSAFFVYYLHETRAYTIYVFFCVMLGWFYWQILTRPHYEVRWLRWGFPFSIAAALYTHYISGAFVAGILVYHMLFERSSRKKLSERDQKRWLAILKLWVNGCLLFTLWVGVLLSHVLYERDSNRALSLWSLLDSSLYSFSNNTWFLAVPILFSSLMLIQKRAIRFLWVWLIGTIIFIGIMNLLASFLFHPRHFLALIPILALLIAASLFELYKRSKLLAIVLLVVWLALGTYYSLQDDFLNPIPKQIRPLPMVLVETAQDFTEQCVSAEDTVIFAMTEPEIEHHYAPPFRLYYFLNVDYRVAYLGSLLSDNESITELPEALQAEDYAARVAGMTSDAELVWVLSRTSVDIADERDLLSTLLEDNGFNYCGIANDENDLLSEVYSQNDDCEIVVSSCISSD